MKETTLKLADVRAGMRVKINSHHCNPKERGLKGVIKFISVARKGAEPRVSVLLEGKKRGTRFFADSLTLTTQ